MTIKRPLLPALMATIVLLSGCGGSDGEKAASSSRSTSTTNTTIDPASLSLTQDIKALPSSDFTTSPALVSAQVLPGQNSSALASGQVSAADVARQEQLLSELNAQRNADGIVVSLPEVVLFDFGKSDLRPDSAASLDKVAELLKFYPRLNVSVEGHTDNVGSDGANQTLSERRATAVKDGLLARGADAARLTTAGFGESRPAAPNDSDANRQKNRRVEVVFNGA